MHERVAIGQLVDELQASLTAGAETVVISLERHEPDALDVELKASASSGVDSTRARAEVQKRLGAMRACYSGAAYNQVDLAGPLALHATISATGAVQLDVPRHNQLVSCIAESFAGLTLPRVKAAGTIDVDLLLTRTAAGQ